MMKFKEYETFSEGLIDKAHEYDFSYEDFRDYFFYYSDLKKDDLEFYYSYISKFCPNKTKKLLDEFPLENLFKENDISEYSVYFVVKKIRIMKDGKLEKELEFPLNNIKMSPREKSVVNYLFYLDKHTIIKLIYLNYLK